MLRLLIFAVTMLLLSSICNGQGRSSFGASRAQDTSFTIAQVKFTAYGGSLDTMLMIVMPNGDVKKVSKNQFGSDAGFGLLKSGNTIYADTSILFKQGGNDFGISTGIIGSTSGSLDIIAYNDSKITLGNGDVTTFNLNEFVINTGSLTHVDAFRADSVVRFNDYPNADILGTDANGELVDNSAILDTVVTDSDIAVPAGAVVFGRGDRITYDNDDLHWDSTNHVLSVDTGASAQVGIVSERYYPKLNINGSIYANSPNGEHVLVNRRTTGIGVSSANVLVLQHMAGNGSVAMRLKDSIHREMGAFGYQSFTGGSFALNGYVFVSSSVIDSNGTYLNANPRGICLLQHWNDGANRDIRRLDIDSNWNISFRDKSNRITLQAPALGGLTFNNNAGTTTFSLAASGSTVASVIPNSSVTTTWGSDGHITHQATASAGGGLILANSVIAAGGQFMQFRVKNTSGSDISTYIFKNNGNTASGATNGASDFVISNDAGGGNIVINNSTATGGIRFFLQDIERGAMDSSAGFNWGNGRATRIANSGKFSRYAASAITNGQLLIGHTANGTFEKATLTGSAGVDVTNGAGAVTLTVDLNDISDTGLPVYADNAAALAGGLVAGQLYRTSTGQLMIVF